MVHKYLQRCDKFYSRLFQLANCYAATVITSTCACLCVVTMLTVLFILLFNCLGKKMQMQTVAYVWRTGDGTKEWVKEEVGIYKWHEMPYPDCVLRTKDKIRKSTKNYTIFTYESILCVGIISQRCAPGVAEVAAKPLTYKAKKTVLNAEQVPQ